MPKIWTRGGKLLVNDKGNLSFCDSCPCNEAAPCSCPCGDDTGETWPGDTAAGWPCGGLQRTYSFSNYLLGEQATTDTACANDDTGNTYNYRVVGPETLTASDTSCIWTGTGTGQYSFNGGDSWTDDMDNPVDITLSLQTGGAPTNCYWEVDITATARSVQRFVGTTPGGTYLALGCDPSLPASYYGVGTIS